MNQEALMTLARPILFSGLIWIIVQVFKVQLIDRYIQKRFRIIAILATCFAVSFVVGLKIKADWFYLSALTIVGHQVFIEGMLHGREPFRKKKTNVPSG